MTDRELIDRYVTHRDQDAFTALVKRYIHLVFWVCRRRGLGQHDSEDVSQRTFLALLSKAPSFDLSRLGHKAIRYWICRAARLSALTLLSQNRRFRDFSRLRPVKKTVVAHTPTEPDPHLWAAVKEELDHLSNQQRMVLHLHYFEEMTYRQIARKMGIPWEKVDNYLYKARQRLRERLTARGMGPAEKVTTLPKSHLMTLPEDQLCGLSPKLRQVVVSYFREGKSAPQIARELNVPPGTVYARVLRIRKILHERAK